MSLPKLAGMGSERHMVDLEPQIKEDISEKPVSSQEFKDCFFFFFFC